MTVLTGTAAPDATSDVAMNTAIHRGRRGAVIAEPSPARPAAVCTKSVRQTRQKMKRPAQHRRQPVQEAFQPQTEEGDIERAQAADVGPNAEWSRVLGTPARAAMPEPTPWWLSSDGEHAHTACPLRPFAHMVVAVEKESAEAALQGDAGSMAASGHKSSNCGDCRWRTDHGSDDACAMQPALTAERLSGSRIVHLSEALRRKMASVTSTKALGSTVGEVLRVSARDRHAAGGSPARVRSASAGLWGMLGWLVGAQDRPHQSQTQQQLRGDCSGDSSSASWPRRRQGRALAPDDDPHFVGNEGLGAVQLASVRSAAKHHGCVFALCAHALSADMQGEWLAWRRASARGSHAAGDPSVASGTQLAVVHVAEVSTLHRAACNGIDALMPPPLPLPLDQYFGLMADTSRAALLGPPPVLPPLLMQRPDAGECDVDADIRWISLLVSRHGLVEMAYPLARTPVVPAADADSNDPALEPCPPVALGSYLGESVFSRIHPEDVVRVVKALRLAWDARPDVYHFSRLRREWQRRRLIAADDFHHRAVASAPSTPPLRPHRAATVSAAASISAALPGSPRNGLHQNSRCVYHQDGIEVSNGVVELTVQIQLTGAAAVDWSDPDCVAEHARFARMKLTRWPLILKSPRTASVGHRGGSSYNQIYPPEELPPEDPQDGFVLIGLRPLPEPARTRSRSTADAYDLASDMKKLSISSATSAATLVAASHGVMASSSSSLGSAELVRLCRSSSSLSCHETTARPSIEFLDSAAAAVPVRPGTPRPLPPNSSGSGNSHHCRGGDNAAVAVPLPRPIVGLSNNAVQTATGMSPHLSMRRRSNITVGSQQRSNPEEGLAARAYEARCELTC
ncbi:hypothetical protein H4S06_001535 [Coemansia sp. BCRC 34490]|nr:hypothetical protein H4S06_001535 [Coemansia sp. BCRC 34490]